MAKQRIKREKDFEKGTVSFTVLDTGDSFGVKVSDLPEEIKTALLVHGINAKVGDAAADPKVDPMAAMQSVWEQLKSGTWAARSAGDGTGRVTVLAEALQKVTGQPMDDVQDKLGEMSDEEKKDLRKHPQVQSAIADIQAEKAKAKAALAGKAAKGAKDDEALDF